MSKNTAKPRPVVDEEALKREVFIAAMCKTAIRNTYHYGYSAGAEEDALVPILVDIVLDPNETNKWGEDKLDQLARKIRLFHDGADLAVETALQILASVKDDQH